jgi:hypothetical protein
MDNKSAADIASRKASTTLFVYGIYMDLLRILGMWLTVMCFFLVSKEHGSQRIYPEGLKKGVMAKNTLSHTCTGLNKEYGDVQEAYYVGRFENWECFCKYT